MCGRCVNGMLPIDNVMMDVVIMGLFGMMERSCCDDGVVGSVGINRCNLFF